MKPKETKDLRKPNQEKFMKFQKNQRRLPETNLVQFDVSDLFRNLFPTCKPELLHELDLDSQDFFVGTDD
jgi:hypothetical protein